MYHAPKLYPIACVLVPNFIRFELGHKEVDLDLSSQILGPLLGTGTNFLGKEVYFYRFQVQNVKNDKHVISLLRLNCYHCPYLCIFSVDSVFAPSAFPFGNRRLCLLWLLTFS